MCKVEICCSCSITQLCLTLCDPMDCSMPGFPIHHYLLEFAQAQVHWVDVAIQPSHPLLVPSSPVLNLSHHQALFQWVSSSHHVANILELQLNCMPTQGAELQVWMDLDFYITTFVTTWMDLEIIILCKVR